jgi:sec-independent protein translocase protein TatA
MRSIGPVELLLILVIVVLIFGVGKLAEAGAGIGKAIREFRNAISGETEEETSDEE